jgi:hypothetical protein
MTIWVEFAVSAPSLALPRMRERGPTVMGARESIAFCRAVFNELSTRQSPPPLAGKGWGGGHSIAAAAS